MNCRKAEEAILAAAEGALDESGRGKLEAHLAACPDCRRAQQRHGAVGGIIRLASEGSAVPDVEAAWRSIRNAMRGVGMAGERPARASLGWRLFWIGTPLVAAAVLAVALVVGLPGLRERDRLAQASPEGARAEFVEVGGDASSAVVYLDEPSGWLVVWSVREEPGR